MRSLNLYGPRILWVINILAAVYIFNIAACNPNEPERSSSEVEVRVRATEAELKATADTMSTANLKQSIAAVSLGLCMLRECDYIAYTLVGSNVADTYTLLKRAESMPLKNQDKEDSAVWTAMKIRIFADELSSR